ncbi:MAG: PilW family protein [Pseudomonadota bacterium]|nr:PilW family protein [Pseudomonadota bacterium]
MNKHRQAAHQTGLTLVEILVALAVSLVLLAGIVQIYAASKQSYRVTDALSRQQENARYAMEILARDIRSAGLLGCGGRSTRVANSVNDAGAWYAEASAIIGYEGGVDSFPEEYASDVLSGTDSVILRYANTDDTYMVTKHVPDSATIHLADDHDLKQGEILVIANADCTQVGVFQMSNTNLNNTISIVDHNTGGATSPGNCTKTLWGDWDCNGSFPTNPTKDMAYDSDSFLLRFAAHAYYIGSSSSPGNPPALFRERLSGGSTTSEELVEGVEDLQIQYGEDTDEDQIANLYRPANQVADWGNIVSVNLSLLLRTTEDSLSQGTQSVSYNGGTVTATDRRLRMAHSATVNLRNRVP